MAWPSAVRGGGGGGATTAVQSHTRHSPVLPRDRLAVTLLGPTTLHLRHELSLLITMTLLTAASLIAPYRSSFGTSGDILYISLTALWLSRHLLLRWLCANDTSTSSSPTVLGTAAQVLGRCCSAGQYFDPPTQAELALYGGGDYQHHGHESPGGRLIRLARTRGALLYVWVIGPLCGAWDRTVGWAWSAVRARLLGSNGDGGGGRTYGQWASSAEQQHGRGGGASSGGGGGGGGKRDRGDRSSSVGSSIGGSSSSLSASLRQTVQSSALIRNLAEYWDRYVPPAQLCVAVGTVLGILFGLLYFHSAATGGSVWGGVGGGGWPIGSAGGPTAGFPGGGGAFHQTGMAQPPNPANKNNQQGGQQNQNQQNQNQPQQNNPNQPQVTGGTGGDPSGGGSNFWGGPGGGGGGRHRSGGPFGSDPPSTMHVLFHIGWASTLAGLALFGRVLLPVPDLAAGTSIQKSVRAEGRHYGGGGSKSSKPRNKDLPWAEQYKPINSENRFRLHCRIMFLRVIENVVLCALGPQTEFACVATGHCEPSPNVWELPGITGVSTGRTGVGVGPTGTMYDNLVHDYLSSVILAFTVALLTVAILLAQVATLDRSYLAIMGYVGGDLSFGSDGGGSSSRSGGRHRDRRGDALHHHGGSRGSDSFSSADGRPIDVYMRAVRDLFRSELGHPSTSRVLALASGGLAFHFIFLVFACILYWVMDYDAMALAMTMLATFVATDAVVSIGMLDYPELEILAKEIAAPLEAQGEMRYSSAEASAGR